MAVTDTERLLAEYNRSGSEAAFRELVSRYLDLVYSAAVRLVDGDRHLAEDVAQTVFADLARGARKLPESVALGGWLHRHTCFVAANMMRSKRRRERREREAVDMNTQPDHSAAFWARIAPEIDAAVNQLASEDRAAIMLRFFEQQDFRAIGSALGIREDAARMRVNRALEKLQGLMKQGGVTASATTLGAALADGAVSAAPAGLAASISSAVLLGTTVGGTTLLGLMVASKLKFALVALVLTGAALSLVLQQLSLSALKKERASLQEQLTRAQSRSETLGDELANRSVTAKADDSQLRELMRLRNEVTVLRRQERDLAAANARAARAPVSGSTERTTPIAAATPFQVQLVVDEPGDDSETLTNLAGGKVAETLNVQRTPLMDYTSIASAEVMTDPQTGSPQISVQLSESGKEQFAKITRENLNKRLAIVLGGQVYSAPVIRSEISGGKAQISGSFSREEAEALAKQINDAIGRK